MDSSGSLVLIVSHRKGCKLSKTELKIRDKMIMKKISEICKILDSPLSITASLIAIIPFFEWGFGVMYKPYYAQKCALFYVIPEKYFKQVDLNINFYSYLQVIVALMVMLIILLIKNHTPLSVRFNIILNTVFGALVLILITFINDYHIINIISREVERRNHIVFVTKYVNSIPFWIYIISAILGIMYTASFTFALINEDRKWCKLIKSFIVLLTVLIGLVSFGESLPIEPEKKSQYEVTLIQEDEGELDNRVILADLGDQYLTVSYKLYPNSSIHEFYTGNYKLLNKEGLDVWLMRFNGGIKIVNDDSITLNN